MEFVWKQVSNKFAGKHDFINRKTFLKNTTNLRRMETYM